MDINAGHWVLISDGNPDKLRTFFQGCREQGVETRGFVFCQPDKISTILNNIDWPNGWSACPHESYYHPPSDDKWIGVLWDDQCPESAKWDVRLVEQVTPWNVVTSQDGADGDWRKAAICWGAECFRTRGLRVEDVDQDLIDWARAAADAKCWLVDRLVQIPRHSKPEGKYEVRDVSHHISILKALMKKHNVRLIETNWTGVSLQISTPSGASRPEALYAVSMFATMRELECRGVAVQWSLERYNADVGLARSHIFSEFFRSTHTHLLMIDDDMVWEMPAINRLIHADKPLVAVAGPKKRYPLVFAASYVDENNTPLPLMIDQEAGCCEVTHVGAAFMLIRRDCAEAMVKAYPELEYIGSDGKISWGMFVQQVENRAYLPEDFSFCNRYRKIGGHVYICPDVPLGHIGAHEFRGDLLSNAMKAQNAHT